MNALFRQFELTLPHRTIPVSVWGFDDRIAGIRLDFSADDARQAFADAGAPPLTDDPAAFPLFEEDLATYRARGTHRWRAPIQFVEGTPFQRRVWEGIDAIAPGCTSTYGELAETIGSPQAVRAIGGACGRNPIPLRVPCHRVVAAGGKLGGFTGVLATKRALLEHEAGVVSAELFAERLPPDRGESLHFGTA